MKAILYSIDLSGLFVTVYLFMLTPLYRTMRAWCQVPQYFLLLCCGHSYYNIEFSTSRLDCILALVYYVGMDKEIKKNRVIFLAVALIIMVMFVSAMLHTRAQIESFRDDVRPCEAYDGQMTYCQ